MSASTSETLDLWYVKLPNGDVHRVTLDQLDGAFQGGRIDGRTMVMPADGDAATSWTSLSQLLGLEDEAVESPAPAYAPAPVAMPVAVRAPVAVAYASVAPVSATPPPVAYGRVQVPVANSLRPMSFDLGAADVDDVQYPRPSRKGWVVAVLGLAAAAGVAGFVSTQHRSGGGDDISTVAAAAAMAVPPSYAPAPLPAAPQPTPYVTPTPAAASGSAPAEASPMNPQFTDRFNQGTKQKLLAADQAREDKAKARHAAAGAYHPSSHSSKSSNVFTTGGNKYDPLNSNL
jgi:hypothetical protein